MAEPEKKPDAPKSRRQSKWPKATLEAEVKALRDEVSSLRGRVSELEASASNGPDIIWPKNKQGSIAKHFGWATDEDFLDEYL